MSDQPEISMSNAASSRVSTTAMVQFVLAGLGGYFAWHDFVAAAGPLPASFWGWLALLLFCFPLGVLNQLAPWLRSRFASAGQTPYRLPVRLESFEGTRDTVFSLLAFGTAFAAPALPLAIQALRLHSRDSEFVLVPAGLALISAGIGAIMVFVSASQLYKLLARGDAIVEAGANPVQPGQTVPLFVVYRPGRLMPDGIRVSLVCIEIRREYRLRTSSTEPGSSTEKKEVIHEALLYEQTPDDGPLTWPWQQSLAMEIPPGARPSTPIDHSPTVMWSVDLAISVPNSPDFTLSFPVHVGPVDQPEEEAL